MLLVLWAQTVVLLVVALPYLEVVPLNLMMALAAHLHLLLGQSVVLAVHLVFMHLELSVSSQWSSSSCSSRQTSSS